MKKYQYANQFYIKEDFLANRAAKLIVPYLLENLNIRSVVDVGCGTGSWLKVFDYFGITEYLGVDFHANLTSLRISQSNFININLNDSIVLGKTFDMAISLEVAEHLYPSQSARFVSDLCDLSNIILFSAAVPGQGGENHINERKIEYWRNLFKLKGYLAYDAIRSEFVDNKLIAPWYRFNTILYINPIGYKKINSIIAKSFIPSDIALRRYESFLWRIRCFLIRLLPVGLSTFFAKIQTYLIHIFS